MRILLIEDDPEAASCILNGLAKLGHVGEHVADGREGRILPFGDSVVQAASHLAPVMPDPGLLTACAPLAALIRTTTASTASFIFLILPYAAPYLAVQVDTRMAGGHLPNGAPN